MLGLKLIHVSKMDPGKKLKMEEWHNVSNVLGLAMVTVSIVIHSTEMVKTGHLKLHWDK